MVDPHDPPDRRREPLTSEPGELYTVEGRIAAAQALARGLVERDPPGRGYRRSMARLGFGVVGAAIAVSAIVIALT